jgi:Fe-S-cluster containining protein
METNQFQAGLALLQNPVLPLARLVQILFITGPFSSVADVLAELHEPIETNTSRYDDPPAVLAPFLDILEEYQRLKNAESLPCQILDVDNNQLDAMEALDLWVSQKLLTRELERINSLLCAPCGCTLCCIGPDDSHSQLFFEIPLSNNERTLFSLPYINGPESHQLTPYSETVLEVDGRPFYDNGPALYQWQSSLSMILPKGASCQKLLDNGRCTIYPQRPEVCRRPQIFPYVLEPSTAVDQEKNFTAQRKLLAIWDCPYVKQCKNEIAAYAEICELEPVFKKNKS